MGMRVEWWCPMDFELRLPVEVADA